MKTTYPKQNEVPQAWHLVDAKDQVLGRMASRLARVLMGKHRPIYSPHFDTGEYVVVINAAQLKLTGLKAEQRMIRHHTGWVGGLKEVSLGAMMEKSPEDVVRLAVRRMLPKTRLGRQMIKKLKVYPGAEHPHAAQSPTPLDWTQV